MELWGNVSLSNAQRQLITWYHERYGISITKYFGVGYKFKVPSLSRINPYYHRSGTAYLPSDGYYKCPQDAIADFKHVVIALIKGCELSSITKGGSPELASEASLLELRLQISAAPATTAATPAVAYSAPATTTTAATTISITQATTTTTTTTTTTLTTTAPPIAKAEFRVSHDTFIRHKMKHFQKLDHVLQLYNHQDLLFEERRLRNRITKLIGEKEKLSDIIGEQERFDILTSEKKKELQSIRNSLKYETKKHILFQKKDVEQGNVLIHELEKLDLKAVAEDVKKLYLYGKKAKKDTVNFYDLVEKLNFKLKREVVKSTASKQCSSILKTWESNSITYSSLLTKIGRLISSCKSMATGMLVSGNVDITDELDELLDAHDEAIQNIEPVFEDIPTFDLTSREGKEQVIGVAVVLGLVKESLPRFMKSQGTKTQLRTLAETAKFIQADPGMVSESCANIALGLMKVPAVEEAVSAQVINNIQKDFSPIRCVQQSVWYNMSIASIAGMRLMQTSSGNVRTKLTTYTDPRTGKLRYITRSKNRVIASLENIYNAKRRLQLATVKYYAGGKRGKNAKSMVHCDIKKVVTQIIKYCKSKRIGFDVSGKQVSPIRLVIKADGSPLENDKSIYAYGVALFESFMANEVKIPRELWCELIGFSYGLPDTKANFKLFLGDVFSGFEEIRKFGFDGIEFYITYTLDLKAHWQAMGCGDQRCCIWTFTNYDDRNRFKPSDCFCTMHCSADGIKNCTHYEPLVVNEETNSLPSLQELFADTLPQSFFEAGAVNCFYNKEFKTTDGHFHGVKLGADTIIERLKEIGAINPPSKPDKYFAKEFFSQIRIRMDEIRLILVFQLSDKLPRLRSTLDLFESYRITLFKSSKGLQSDEDASKFPTYISYTSDEVLIYINLRLYINHELILEGLDSTMISGASRIEKLRTLLKLILKLRVMALRHETFNKKMYKRLIESMFATLCRLHLRLRTLPAIVNILMSCKKKNSVDFDTTQAGQNQMKVLKKKFKDKLMEALDIQDIKLEYADNEKTKSTRIKFDMPGGDLNKVFGVMDSLLNLFFEHDSAPFEDWRNILSLFTNIHIDLARLSKYWGDLEIKELRDKISNLHSLLMKYCEDSQITIYLHMIFNGTVLNQLRERKNLSSQDNQPFEYDMKVAKTRLEYMTNRRDIPKVLYLQSAAHFTLRIAGMGKIGDEYFLNSEFQQIFEENKTTRQLKQECKELLRYDSYHQTMDYAGSSDESDVDGFYDY